MASFNPWESLCSYFLQQLITGDLFISGVNVLTYLLEFWIFYAVVVSIISWSSDFVWVLHDFVFFMPGHFAASCFDMDTVRSSEKRQLQSTVYISYCNNHSNENFFRSMWPRTKLRIDIHAIQQDTLARMDTVLVQYINKLTLKFRKCGQGSSTESHLQIRIEHSNSYWSEFQAEELSLEKSELFLSPSLPTS